MTKIRPMGAFRDSGLCLALAASLLLAAPAMAENAPAKKAVRPATKPAAAMAAPLTAADLMAQARQAESRGDHELAVRLAQSAIVVAPDRPDTYDTLGDMYAAQNQPDFARSYYNEALSIDPADAPALQALAALDRGTSDQRAANTEGSQTRTP
jgi:tetratricopeptide (TPR) repeat protein